MSRVSSAAARLMSTAKTFAPSRANSAAAALPFPHPGPTEPAPATSTTLPCSRGFIVLKGTFERDPEKPIGYASEDDIARSPGDLFALSRDTAP